MKNAPTLSNSALLYLFADRLMPRAVWRGVSVPCRNVKVRWKPLAAALYAAAFHGLREQGLISLELFTKKVLLIKTTRVKSTLIRHEARWGLESTVLNYLRDEDTVEETILRWVHKRGGPSPPFKGVVKVVIAEVVNARLIQRIRADRGSIGGLSDSGRTRLVPKCEAIQPLEAAFNDWLVTWETFKRTETRLYKKLFYECWRWTQDYSGDVPRF